MMETGMTYIEWSRWYESLCWKIWKEMKTTYGGTYFREIPGLPNMEITIEMVVKRRGSRLAWEIKEYRFRKGAEHNLRIRLEDIHRELKRHFPPRRWTIDEFLDNDCM